MFKTTKRINHLFFLVLLTVYACWQNPEEKAAITTPTGFLLEEADLPDYEKRIDHARLISTESREFYHKGMITYRNVCFSCHGNDQLPGSMPHAMKFWQDTFKHGSDPYSIYETLTRGYGLMAPQVRLSPREKYEVIHFIRQEFIKEDNPDQYFEVDENYLSNLPKGDTLGPDPQKYQPWAEMDYGDFLIYTYELADSTSPERNLNHRGSPIPNEDLRDINFAYKGIAMRLDEGDGGIAAGSAFAIFDHDLLRFTGFWTGDEFIDYRSILLNDEHNIYPRTVGKIQVENPITPGWANPATGDFKDPRFVAVDGRPFGPLPRQWAHYKGLYYHGSKIIIKYTIANAEVLELYGLAQQGTNPVMSRTLNLSASDIDLTMRIAPENYAVALKGDGGTLSKENGFWVMKVKAGKAGAVKIYLSGKGQQSLDDLLAKSPAPEDLSVYTRGGPAHYVNQVLSSPVQRGNTGAAYEVDVLVLPQENPWKSRMRPSGIEFIDGGETALVCTIDGEVWRLEGITQEEGMVKWHRIATGLFQPLGIKYQDGNIYVGCRDQIVVLRDLNGDGETDFYESFNSDHQVTEHFHEFAMGLQTDNSGNFYYAKSGRHARNSLTPRHGTLIKVSPDGQQSEIMANGFRAANGVCLNPDGSFYVTDQEGHWNPMNRINRVTEGGFYGNMYSYNPPPDTSDEAMIHPMFWVDMKYDRSPAELLWVESEKWGPLNGALLNLSYGYGKIFVVMSQMVDEKQQGGMVELPIPQAPTGLMRGRFNPKDGQLYTCGMSAWATSQMIQVGGLYRIRYTGKPLNLPVQLGAFSEGIQVTFSDPLDPEVEPSGFTINTWDLKRTHFYGSKRYNTKTLKIEKITLSEDGKTVFIHMPEIQPTWVMEILFDVKNREGESVKGAIQSSIYKLEKSSI